MGLRNVSTLYQRINKGSEGGNEFARLCNLLLIADCKDNDYQFQSFDDSSGDFKGVDFIRFHEGTFNEVKTGFQFKFFPRNLSSSQKANIRRSLLRAKEIFPLMDQWILVTPEDMLKPDLEWLEKLNAEFEHQRGTLSIDGIYRSYEFNVFHWGHAPIVELCLKYPHIGRPYFPELYTDQHGNLQLANFSIDQATTRWENFENTPLSFYLSNEKNKMRFTTDPVFDIQILNNTSDRQLLQSIDIDVENIWVTLKGIPSSKVLKSSGTELIDIDFSRKINTHIFKNPVDVGPKEAFRFKIKLRNFSNRVPGNWIKLKFSLNFNDNTAQLHSKSFTFSL